MFQSGVANVLECGIWKGVSDWCLERCSYFEKHLKLKSEKCLKLKPEKHLKLKSEKCLKLKSEKHLKLKSEKCLKLKSEKHLKLKSESIKTQIWKPFENQI